MNKASSIEIDLVRHTLRESEPNQGEQCHHPKMKL